MTRLPDGLYNIGEGHEPQRIAGRHIPVLDEFIIVPAVDASVVDVRAVLCDVIAAWAEANAPQFGGRFVSTTNGLVRDLRERDINDLILVAQNYRETHK